MSSSWNRLRIPVVRLGRTKIGQTSVSTILLSPSLGLSTASYLHRTPGVLASGLKRRFFHFSPCLLKDYPQHTLFPMPALSPTMEVGSIASWSVKEGDSFSAGDVLCSIETDKASVDFEAQDDGVLAKILRQGANAQDIAIGTPICVVVDDAGDVPAFTDFVVDGTAAPVASVLSSSAPPPTTTVPPTVATTAVGGVLMPSARHLAESKGLDATGLLGSGKGGRILKSDVMEAIVAGAMPPLANKPKVNQPTVTVAATAPAPSPVVGSVKTDLPLPFIDSIGSFQDLPNSKMRKIIAKRLTESKREVPHFYASMEVELDNIMALRKRLATKHDVKVSVNDFVIRCCALSLRDVPEVNGTFDGKSGSVRLQNSIDISVAVATPTGLITPIVFNTDTLGLSEITDTVRDLAGRAREGKLAPHEYQGGTFSVSNLGMFGIDEFSAVINPPQAAILAVGGGSRRVVPTPYVDGAYEQSKPTVKTIMTARLSADRRVVDEATGSLFMSAFRHYINEPDLLLL